MIDTEGKERDHLLALQIAQLIDRSIELDEVTMPEIIAILESLKLSYFLTTIEIQE
jgi:hypothetical protein